MQVAHALDAAAAEIGIDFVGGFSALVQKGFTARDTALIQAIPQAIAETQRVCSSVNVASTRAGINMDAIRRMAGVASSRTPRRAPPTAAGSATAKLVVFANIPEDNPFVAGAMHGIGEGECVDQRGHVGARRGALGDPDGCAAAASRVSETSATSRRRSSACRSE